MIVLLDNGHGGIINGQYTTPGKRSPIWADGSQLFEGEFNRSIVKGICERLDELCIHYVNIVPELQDVSLKERVRRANELQYHECFYLSVHSNAGGGEGCEFFTSVGNTKSDQIATIFGEEFKREFPDRRLRTDFSDGDLDKEKNFYVLKNTVMPAVLTENFFMDNERECKEILMTCEGRERIINYHIEAIKRIQRELFI